MFLAKTYENTEIFTIKISDNTSFLSIRTKIIQARSSFHRLPLQGRTNKASSKLLFVNLSLFSAEI